MLVPGTRQAVVRIEDWTLKVEILPQTVFLQSEVERKEKKKIA